MEKAFTQFEINGTTISPGITIGKACHYQTGSIEQSAVYKIQPDQIKTEMKRFHAAIDKSKKELQKIAKNIEKMVGENEAKIFYTHIALLEDKQLIEKVEKKLNSDKINIEAVVKNVFEEYEDIFEKMDDEYLKDRGTDFSEVKRRVLGNLTGEQGRFICRHECLVRDQGGRIILTKELTPSMISLLENKNIDGFITVTGGKNSHAAILARAIGIPYITDINIIDKIECESTIIIDGNKSKIFINPAKSLYEKYEKIILNEQRRIDNIQKNIGSIVETKDGNKIEIYGNVINLNDIEYIKKFKLGGIGLLRTEFLFFEKSKFPSIDEQVNEYKKIIEKTNPLPVTFRLMDIGGDKRLKSLKFNDEENPLLGLRGIRYLMKNKKLLTDQVSAICKASESGNVKILYPMISDIDELIEVNKLVKDVLKKFNRNNKIKIGMMFEVPSVFIDPVPFLKEIDFASIGSNDLVQYLYGVDRNNSDVSHLYKQDSNPIYNLLTNLVINAKALKKDVTLCGEIDFNSNFFKRSIEIGIKKFSISPIVAPTVIEKIREISVE